MCKQYIAENQRIPQPNQALLAITETIKNKLYQALLPANQLKQEFLNEIKKLRSQYE